MKVLKAVLAFAVAVLSSSCSYGESSLVPFTDAQGRSAVLQARNRAALEGRLQVSAGKLLEYDAGGLPTAAGSLELEYRIESPGEVAASALDPVVLRIAGEDSWILPSDASVLGLGKGQGAMRYRVPLSGSRLGSFTIGVEPMEAAGKAKRDDVPVFRLLALRLVPRWYGYIVEESGVTASPFVALDASAFTIDLPERFRPADSLELRFGGSAGRLLLQAGSASFEYLPPPTQAPEGHVVPAAGLARDPFPLVLSGEAFPSTLSIAPASPRAFPVDPIPADPAVVLAYRREAWRDDRYEVFSWDRFPSILIFDTANYAIQDRLFKRLAFYVEKAGFRGRLAADGEIAHLHGWNAHDYRAEDLASFFELARSGSFPLNAEERELEAVLLAAGIIVKGDTYSPGEGAVISLSRESEGYLRTLFMVHEAFHGLFFIDAEFRAFARRRWEQLDPTAKAFLSAYFDSRRYDVKDTYLMTNELMAYCLQQPVSLAGRYFGKTLAERLAADPRRRDVLPSKDDASGSWPEIADAFVGEAAAFSSYVEGRWGVSAGRVWRFYQRSRSSAER